jgi:hypothetical protein
MAKKKVVITHCSCCPNSHPRFIGGCHEYETRCVKMDYGKNFLYYTQDEECGCDDKEPYSTPIPDNCPLEDAENE